MQMDMIVYSIFDVFDEKSRITAAQENETQLKNYLGLLLESFLGLYELDVYGYITPTNYKIVILKNETKTNAAGMKPAEITLQALFQKIQSLHASMVLNPFFELSIATSSS
jgi:hypothetical protein